jgi:hypothetical protein
MGHAANGWLHSGHDHDDGRELRSSVDFSEWLDRPVTLTAAAGQDGGTYEVPLDFENDDAWVSWQGPGDAWHDSTVSRVSLVTTATLGDWDRRRFRTNVILDGAGEDELIGDEIDLGGARLGVMKQIDRCVMVTRPQPGLERDLDVLRTINAQRATFLAVGALVVTSLVLSACADDDASPTPEQREAISSLIDAELTAEEERCVLEGLIETEIPIGDVVSGDVTGEQDAELLSAAVACIEDLSAIPGFVQAFIDSAAEEGTELTDEEARCAIRHLDADDPAAALAACLGSDDPNRADPYASQDYGDDDVFDLLWDACAGGNNQICDELAATAPEDSAYREFGRTCAGLMREGAVNCFDELG